MIDAVKPPVDVLIAGAGLGGALLAKILSHHPQRFRVHLFERDQSESSRWQGLTIGLSQRGVDAMADAGVDCHGLFGVEGARDLFMAPYLRIRNVMTVKYEGVTYSCIVGRSRLRARLIESLRDDDDDDAEVDIQYNKRIVKYEEQDGKVTAFFEDGTSTTGHVLIGADGAKSVVRSQRCPELEPVDLGFWTDAGTLASDDLAKISSEGNAIYALAKEHLVRKNGSRGVSLLSFVDVSSGSPQLLWSLSMPDAVADEYGLRKLAKEEVASLRALSAKAARELVDPEAAQLIELTPDSNMFPGYQITSVAAQTVRSNPLQKQANSVVTLLGDAAHKTTTHAGLGATAALMDATSLAKCLLDAADPSQLPKCLRDYEKLMSVESSKVVAASVMNTGNIHSTSVVGGMFFRGFSFMVSCALNSYYAISDVFGSFGGTK
eukprot:Partr_v1_DN26293_c0_g1_i2_m48518